MPVENGERAKFHMERGTRQLERGDTESAEAEFRLAVSCDANLHEAHLRLAELRMPGENYLRWLRRLHAELVPDVYVEIGVAEGKSLAIARPPTLAVGVDPSPAVAVPLPADSRIFPETSDKFFRRRRLDGLLDGRVVGLGFIDGLHLFEQALSDFMHLEAYCGPRSVLLFHDTIPIDEATQSRERRTRFHVGDIWKAVVCLKRYRPDLDIFTIPAPWSGLTVVIGLDPGSRVLAGVYDEAVAGMIDLPLIASQADMDRALNVVSNDWTVVADRLRARGIG